MLPTTITFQMINYQTILNHLKSFINYCSLTINFRLLIAITLLIAQYHYILELSSVDCSNMRVSIVLMPFYDMVRAYHSLLRSYWVLTVSVFSFQYIIDRCTQIDNTSAQKCSWNLSIEIQLHSKDIAHLHLLNFATLVFFGLFLKEH